MEIRDWLMLHILYQQKNISKTAEILFVSQPAITLRLKQIESEFGVQIVQRGKRGVHFTPKGEYLVKCAEEMLTKFQQIKENLWNMNDRVGGTIRIGVSTFISRYRFPRILKLFRDMHPYVEFNVKTGWSREMFQLVYNQDVHLAFISGDYNWHDQQHLIFEETMCIVSKKEISLDELPHLPRIDYQTDYKLKEKIDDWWTEHYSRLPLVGIEVDKIDTCIEMVLKGLGYAILPRLVIDEDEDIHKLDIVNKEGISVSRKSWMLYHKESLELGIVKAFVEFIEGMDFQTYTLKTKNERA